MSTHDLCTDDDCPCFAAGVESVGDAVAEAIHSINDTENVLHSVLDQITDQTTRKENHQP